MGIGRSPKEGEYKYGKGFIYILRHDPKEYVLTNQGDQEFVETVKELFEQKAKFEKRF
jgi:RNA:NAD 2'-phosphotransferase (TPT1/KptA family)